jgi:hypothetical protein
MNLIIKFWSQNNKKIFKAISMRQKYRVYFILVIVRACNSLKIKYFPIKHTLLDKFF